MKPYVADQEKKASYFEENTSFGQILTLGWQPRVIPIGDKNPGVSKSEVVRIEAVTPVQR